MRIANITEEGKLSGPLVRMALIASALKGSVDTTLVIPEENSQAFREKCDDLGVTYQTFKLTRITKEWRTALRYLIFSPAEIIRLIRYFRSIKFDILHVNGSWQYKGVIAGKLAGRKVLWHLNDTYMPWLFRKLFSVLSPFATGYIYASERTRDYYAPLIKGNKPSFVIPAPVDTVRFNPKKIYDSDKQAVDHWDGKIVIGTIANINPIKGVNLFIRVASRLNISYDNLLFVVIGQIFDSQDNYFKKLQSQCKQLSVDNIIFTGGHNDLRSLLQRLDIYACCSLAESSPIAVWEALSMAKPVVSTDVGDVPLYVRDGKNGFIVDVGDSVAMAGQIAQLINDQDLRHLFGERGRQIAVDKLDLSICAEKHMVAYKSLTHDIH